MFAAHVAKGHDHASAAEKADMWLSQQPSTIKMRSALLEAERFMEYFAGETDGHFAGPGTPASCLALIRSALGTRS